MTEVSTRETSVAVAAKPAARRFTLRQRIVLSVIIWTGSWVIRLIGPTLRVAVSREDCAPETPETRPLIASFWHACMIPATWVCRDLGIRVMSSNSYDGEYMGRIIRKFGFVAVKGSSLVRVTPRPGPLCGGPERIETNRRLNALNRLPSYSHPSAA